MPGNNPQPQPSLPTQLGPFNWNPITFSGCGVTGQMQLTLYSTGDFDFNGTFNDPDFLDYDDSLAFGITSSSGVMFTFTHVGTMHGWGDRWLEGGSATDTWGNTGNSGAIRDAWADLCDGYRWQANAGVNFDIGSVLTDVENLIKAVESVVKIIAIVAA